MRKESPAQSETEHTNAAPQASPGSRSGEADGRLARSPAVAAPLSAEQAPYSYETMPSQSGDRAHYRIRDAHDNAVARCYEEHNAELIVSALNGTPSSAAFVPHPDTLWIVYFEDPDKRPEVFFGPGAEEGARRRYKQAYDHWSCHLLVVRSAIRAPKYLVRSGGECPADWLCADIPEVQKALCEALYGSVRDADVDDIGQYLAEVQKMTERELTWKFEDGWLTVIKLRNSSDRTGESNG